MNDYKSFVKGEEYLNSFQKRIIAKALKGMGCYISPAQILRVYLYHQDDNYYEVFTVGGSFYVHRYSLKSWVAYYLRRWREDRAA